MKKFTTLAIASTIFASALIPTAAKAASVNEGQLMIPVIVNGMKVKFPDTEPYIDQNGRTLVPVRFVSEKLGGTVTWNANTQTATIVKGSKTIDLTIDSKDVKVNGSVTTLDTAAVLTEGRTMVPLRFVSETLGTTVTWDDGAHAVQVTDDAYKAKVASGDVKLDPWGRELSKTWDANWNKLSDLPQSFYDIATLRNGAKGDSNKKFAEYKDFYEGDLIVQKKYVDMWSDQIRQYYALQLNVDYRNLDSDSLAQGMVSHMQFNTGKLGAINSVKEYAKWVRDNHVIARGYADPENSQVRYENGGPVMRTHFKFMIVSADDTAQTFMDNWDVSAGSDSFALDTGVWYDGYADIQLFTTSGNKQREHYAIHYNENMFVKKGYVYNKIED